MILFYNPKATKPRNRRFPLSILAIAAVVEGKKDDAIRGHRDLKDIPGLSYKTADGTPRHNPERPMGSLNDFPWYPYHRLPVEKYLLPTFLGRRTAVHQASIGCPYRCNFCGVVPIFNGGQHTDTH